MKRESVRVIHERWVVFDDHGMTWPMPGKRMGDLEWTLRYGTPSTPDKLEAAGIIAAYAQLVTGNDETRRLVARGIKQGMAIQRAATVIEANRRAARPFHQEGCRINNGGSECSCT